jgi:hypothetical protein
MSEHQNIKKTLVKYFCKNIEKKNENDTKHRYNIPINLIAERFNKERRNSVNIRNQHSIINTGHGKHQKQESNDLKKHLTELPAKFLGRNSPDLSPIPKKGKA